MDIKDYIKLCTKVNKNQGMNNVKWCKVPKDNKQLPDQYPKKPLPYHLAMEKSLHEPKKKHGKGQKKDQKKDEKFQVLEIRQSIQEVSVGWNAMHGLEKRYKESQMKYLAATIGNNSSETNDSFATAHTTVITETDDSFSSTTHDFECLKISESDKNIQSEVLCNSNEKKERYKRNALIKGIIQNKENICPPASTNSRKIPDFLNKVLGNNTNLQRSENKVLKYVQEEGTSKTCKPLKKTIKKDSKQENYLVPKAVKVAETSRKHFMEVSDDCFCEFVTTKSMKNSKKAKKRGEHGF